MPAFKYKALSQDGQKVRGMVEAFDEFEAVAQIKREYDIVLEIRPVPERRNIHIDLNEPLWISNKTLAITASQFAILLRAGLPTARTVETIAQQSSDRLMSRILREVAQDVASGYSLAQSMESRSKKIPVTFIETVRAGEESGTLEQSFEKLAAYYDKTHKTQAKVRGAMMYPLFLLVLAAIVITIVVNVSLPVMTGIITTSGGELPLPTRLLLWFTNFCDKWWPLMLLLTVVLIVGGLYYGKTEQGRRHYGLIVMKLPVLGDISILNSASQFANTMTTLLTAGLPITRALQITGKVMDNYAVGLTVGTAAVGIEEGKRLADVLNANPYLPPLLREMTAVGEESGSLEETLTTIGAYYDSEVAQASSKALSMLEPIITLVLGIVIGFIVIALYLPMFTMYNGM